MVVLARVDQRLIHGLIVNQWAPHLQVKRFMVVDDVLCNNEEIKASMRMAKIICSSLTSAALSSILPSL